MEMSGKPKQRLTIMKKLLYISLIFSAMLVAGCTEDATNDQLLNGGEIGSDETVSGVQGKTIRLYLDADDTRTSLSGISVEWQEGDRVSVNIVVYTVAYDENGLPMLDVAEAEDGVYEAYYPGDYAQFSTTPKHFRLHPMQFYAENSFGPDSNPMWAAATVSDSSETPVLSFKSMCGVLKLTIAGDAEIESIYVEDKAGNIVAGTMGYDATSHSLVAPTFAASSRVVRTGVVLNCVKTDGTGVQLSSGGTPFYIVLPARTYASGLKIRISDTSHRSMTIDSSTARTIGLGEVLLTPTIQYAPKSDCVLEEHFDLMVWGGDYMAGSTNGRGFTPLAANSPAATTATGYERTLFVSTYTYSGSEFMSVVHEEDSVYNMSEQYLRSRGIYSSPWLFRVEERPGYIGIGARSTNGRGRYRSAPFTNLSGASKVAVEFKFCYTVNAATDVDVFVRNSGYISEAYIDGVAVDVSADRYKYTYSTDAETGKLTGSAKFTLKLDEMAVPTSAIKTKTWQTVKLIVNDAYADTALDLYAALSSSSTGTLGYYVDDIVVTKLKDQSGDMLKIMSFNIQNGMWADQGSQYANFIAFVKKHAPDICLWQEARTSYETEPNADGTAKGISTTSLLTGKYLINSKGDLQWGTVAGKYGHSNWNYGAYQDNFPVVITSTSSYPITLVQRLGAVSKGTGTETVVAEVSHGGLHAKVDGINYINLHLWPQKYGKNVATADQETSAANNEGHAYRKGELEYMFNKTVWNDKYSSETNWIMAGDFNSRSPLDESYYNYGLSSPLYWAQNVILESTNFIDIMYVVFGGTCPFGGSRIDYVFASPEMMKRVVRIRFLDKEDEFTTRTKPEGWPFYKYSDHRPILVEFDMSE